MPDQPTSASSAARRAGARPVYTEAARRVGSAAGRGRDSGLVYGGGRVGLMGVVADAALAAGGRVVGVIPEPLARTEIAHEGLTELIVVPGMHERKALMAAPAGGFLALPGGIGTFEEFFEILTWAALGLHRKPIACSTSPATTPTSRASSTARSSPAWSGRLIWTCSSFPTSPARSPRDCSARDLSRPARH